MLLKDINEVSDAYVVVRNGSSCGGVLVGI